MEPPLMELDEDYNLLYYGQTLIHSYYTDPMLPWIVQEISLSKRNMRSKVCLALSTDGMKVFHKKSAASPESLYPIHCTEMDEDTGVEYISSDLISFDEGKLQETQSNDVNSNYVDLAAAGEHLFECRYNSIVHVRRVYLKQCPHLVILIRETKESPLFCHAFKPCDNSSITSICTSIENRILSQSKNGTSCNFSKLGGDNGNGHADSDCIHFEVLLMGIVNIHNPDPPHTLIDEAVVQFNEKYMKLGQQHNTPEKNTRPQTIPVGRELFSNDFTPGSPTSSYMDDSREGSIQMLQSMRQRCNSVDHPQRPPTVRRRQRHRSEPSDHVNNLHRSRIRLFQIGRDSIKLICPNKSTRTCEIEFSNISRCMQGIKFMEHFGIIANKVEYLTTKPSQNNSNGSSAHENHTHHTNSEKKIVCYVFKCTEDYVCEEIMQGIKQAFHSCVSNASPMREYDLICKDVNAVSSSEALSIAKHKMKRLTENEIRCIKAQLMEIKPADQEEKLSAVMVALRQLYEVRHIEHMNNMKTAQRFENDASPPVPVAKTLDSFKSKAITSFGSLLQKGKKKMQELQQDAENISGHLADRNLSSPAQKLKMLSETFSSSAPSTPQKEYGQASSGFSNPGSKKTTANNSPTDSSHALGAMRKRSISLGSKPASVQNLNKASEPHILFYHKIFQSITNTGPLSTNFSSFSSLASASVNPIYIKPHKSYDTPENIRKAWKWAVRQQIIINKIKNIKMPTSSTMSTVCSNYQPDYVELRPVPNEMLEIWDELFVLSSEEREKLHKSVLHAAVQKGITCQTRGRVWKLLRNHCHYDAITANSEYATESYLHMLENLTPSQHAILIDIGRTFPTHPMYCQQLGPGQLSLFNVLKAYSLLDKEVGYCQGLSFIAGILLMHTLVENEAYELLYCLMHEVGCRSMYMPDMKGMKLAIYKITRLLHDIEYDIYEFFDRHEISMMLVATPWFLTMFSSTFPLNFVARVFDLVFLEGIPALFKVAVCLLRENKSKFMKCEDFEEIVNCIRTEIPDSGSESMDSVIRNAMDLDLGFRLQEYEVEYRILQEEIPINHRNAEQKKHLEEQVHCLESVNRAVTESNCGLLHQLQDAQNKVASLQKQLKEATKHTRTHNI